MTDKKLKIINGILDRVINEEITEATAKSLLIKEGINQEDLKEYEQLPLKETA